MRIEEDALIKRILRSEAFYKYKQDRMRAREAQFKEEYRINDIFINDILLYYWSSVFVVVVLFIAKVFS